MVVGIGDIWIILVVVLGPAGLAVVRVKVIELSERTQMREAKTKVLVVARGYDPAAAFAKLNNRVAFRFSEAVAGVDGHQP